MTEEQVLTEIYNLIEKGHKVIESRGETIYHIILELGDTIKVTYLSDFKNETFTCDTYVSGELVLEGYDSIDVLKVMLHNRGEVVEHPIYNIGLLD